MKTITYSQVGDRKVNALKFDETFYKNSGNSVDDKKVGTSEIDVDSVVNALKSNLELLSQLAEALK